MYKEIVIIIKRLNDKGGEKVGDRRLLVVTNQNIKLQLQCIYMVDLDI